MFILLLILFVCILLLPSCARADESPAAKLARIGRITGSDEAIARLDHALLHEAPYISDYI